MLPEAHLAFLDEIFKANSAILNSLLGLLNERTFANGGAAPVRCPLVTVVAASNELPQGDDLSALWDRFPLRFFVGYLAEEGSFRALLTRPAPSVAATLSLADLAAAQAEVAALPLAPAAVDALVSLREALAAEGITASDRRWRESLGILRAHAWLAGRAKVEVADLEPLAHVLWGQPEDRAKVRGRVLGLAAPAYARALEILDAALPARGEALKVRGRTPADLAAVTAALRRLSEARAEVEALASTQGDSPDARVAEVATRLKDAAVEVSRHLTGAKPVGAAR
jgi:MoxR-like ATPase